MTTGEFNRLRRYWQKHLQLMDWDIKVYLYENQESDKQFDGSSAVIPHLRYNQIEICISPEMKDEEIEVTLVHEMLHCFHHRVVPEQEELMEAGVENAAQALVKLRRQVNRRQKK